MLVIASPALLWTSDVRRTSDVLILLIINKRAGRSNLFYFILSLRGAQRRSNLKNEFWRIKTQNSKFKSQNYKSPPKAPALLWRGSLPAGRQAPSEEKVKTFKILSFKLKFWAFSPEEDSCLHPACLVCRQAGSFRGKIIWKLKIDNW